MNKKILFDGIEIELLLNQQTIKMFRGYNGWLHPFKTSKEFNNEEFCIKMKENLLIEDNKILGIETFRTPIIRPEHINYFWLEKKLW